MATVAYVGSIYAVVIVAHMEPTFATENNRIIVACMESIYSKAILAFEYNYIINHNLYLISFNSNSHRGIDLVKANRFTTWCTHVR